MKKNVLLFLFSGVLAFGQDHLSSFNVVSVNYKMSPKWSAFVEGQLRSRRDYSVIDYYEIKGGVGYNFIKNNQLFVGLGRYGTYENKKFSQEEFRLWLQYTLSQRLGRVKFDHRVRLEKRFFHNPIDDINTEAVRYRYRLSATLPINNTKVQEKTLFVNAFEEVFFGKGEPNFKRNRTFAGVGYQFNNSLSATTGYMFQREFSKSGNDNFHFLYFSLNFTIDATDEEKDFIIPMFD